MTRTISTSAKTMGYYVSLPEHIEEEFGSYFENLSKPEQWVLLATLSIWKVYRYSGEPNLRLYDAYTEFVPGSLGSEEDVDRVLTELEQLEHQSEGTIAALIEALVTNITRTHVVES